MHVVSALLETGKCEEREIFNARLKEKDEGRKGDWTSEMIEALAETRKELQMLWPQLNLGPSANEKMMVPGSAAFVEGSRFNCKSQLANCDFVHFCQNFPFPFLLFHFNLANCKRINFPREFNFVAFVYLKRVRN